MASRAWRAANPERQLATQRAYAKRNAARIRAYRARYYATDRERFKEQVRASRYKRLYGITIEQFDEMMRRQGGRCAICRRLPPPGRRLAVDHEHGHGPRVRGLLCRFCNVYVIGKGRDSAEIHLAAAAYLESVGL